METFVRGLLIFLGILLVLGGSAVAATQYAPIDLSSILAQAPGFDAFLLSPTALYAGGGAAGFGLVLVMVGAFTGGKKKVKPAKAEKTVSRKDVSARAKAANPEPAKSEPARSQSARAKPAKADKPKADAIFATEPLAAKPAPATPAPKPAPQPVAAVASGGAPAPAISPKPTSNQAATATTQPPPRPPVAAPVSSASAKPTASAQPPTPQPGAIDPRLANRKRVQDLVTINDALKAYREKHSAYPKAVGLAGFPERGAAWIPGLAPDFLKELPRDPAMSGDKAGPQYVYVSDGADYKLLAQGISLIGGTNVEVLGVRIDMTRQPTPENAAFGFWTPGFASA